MFFDATTARTEHTDEVLATFMGLRVSADQLIVGYRKAARRIPLNGLSVSVEQTESDDGRAIHVTICGAGTPIDLHQAYSYGASGEAQMFAVTVGQLVAALRSTTLAAA